jgi:CheY-like chemotaxis protein
MNAIKKKLTILVVDDQQAFLDAVVDEVKFLGFETISAKDGQEALALARKTKFDIIISDIRMPNKDGQWFLTELRKIQKISPPFIFMTGFADLSVQKAYSMGADGFLGKPLSPEKLETILSKLSLSLKNRWTQPTKEKPIHHLNKNFNSTNQSKKNELIFGRGGLYLAIDKLAYEVGDLVSFKFQFPNEPFKLFEGIGTIVWKKENPQGIADEYGLYFEYLTKDTLTEWLDYLNSHPMLEVIPLGEITEDIK